jgi:hypothetical protein
MPAISRCRPEGGVGSARAIAHAYSAFVTGGEELRLRPETLQALMAPAVPAAHGFYDEGLKVEVQFSLGFFKPGYPARRGARPGPKRAHSGCRIGPGRYATVPAGVEAIPFASPVGRPWRLAGKPPNGVECPFWSGTFGPNCWRGSGVDPR